MEDVFTNRPTRAGSPNGSDQKHILFSDDEEDLCFLAEYTLGEMGFKVTSARTGAEGLELFQEDMDRYDLIVTDQVMPRMSGIELARAVSGARPELPIILCSGTGILTDPKIRENKCIDSWLQKPVLTEELVDAIQKSLPGVQISF